MTVFCKEVLVESRIQGKQTQAIRIHDLTACHKLAVTATPMLLSITYMSAPSTPNPMGLPLKIVCFVMDTVGNFSCADSVSVLEDK